MVINEKRKSNYYVLIQRRFKKVANVTIDLTLDLKTVYSIYEYTVTSIVSTPIGYYWGSGLFEVRLTLMYGVLIRVIRWSLECFKHILATLLDTHSLFVKAFSSCTPTNCKLDMIQIKVAIVKRENVLYHYPGMGNKFKD